MKKKWIYALLGCVLILGCLVGSGYFFVKAYAKDKFAPNTWIDGVYCTGKKPEELNQELLARLEIPAVTVTDSEGLQYTYDLSDADFQYDYSGCLVGYQQNQQGTDFVDGMMQENVITKGDPEFSYNEEKLKAWWEQLPIVTAEDVKPILELRLEEEGYVLYSTLEHHLDVEKGFTNLVNAINERETTLSLADSDCYFDYEMDEEQKETYHTYLKLKDMQKCGLTYDMGAEKIVFDEARTCKFIAKDPKGNPLKNEDGEFYYDLDALESFMEELCESYRTYGVDRPFKTSRESGEIVMVKAGNFGTEIDVKAEKAYIREVFEDERLRTAKTDHVPTYLHETLFRGLDDTGGTYIEVDKTEQKIYFYKDYKLMVTSGVVTGNLRTRHDTYEGAFCIQGKYKNRVLRGPGYASFVRRWMPIYRAIGLHDANWRKEAEFGGDTYKRNGSHGCVNMPDETTDIIFEYAEIGTPVFIFSTPEK